MCFDKIISLQGTVIDLRSIIPAELTSYYQTDFRSVQWQAYTAFVLVKKTDWQDRAVLLSSGVDFVAATTIGHTKSKQSAFDRQQRLF